MFGSTINKGILLLALAASGSVLAQPPPSKPEEPYVAVGSARLAGRDIAIKVPRAGTPIPDTFPHYSQGGWNYAFNGDGTFQARYKVDGGGGDLLALWPEASQKASQAPIWRIRAFVLTRAEIIEKSRDGLYRPRRGTLEASQITGALEALTRFKAMAEVATGGAVQIQIDASIDDDPIRSRVEGTGEVFGRDWLERRYRAQINSSPFDADDRVYRGPFNSLFVIHPGLVEAAVGATVSGTPAAAVPYYLGVKPPYDLAKNLYDAWVMQVRQALVAKGYPVQGKSESARVEAYVTPSMWSVLADHSEPDRGYPGRKWSKTSAGPWSSLSADPWTKLPRLEAVPAEAVGAPLWAADVLAEKSGGQALGWVDASPEPLIVFSGHGTPAALFGVTGAPMPTPPRPAVFGHFRLAKVADTEKGNVMEVTELGAYRYGAAKVTEAPLGVPSAAPMVEFWIKVDASESYRLFSSAGDVLEINPAEPWPAELGARTNPVPAVFVKPGQWTKVAVNVSRITGALGDLWLAPTTASYYFERQQMDPAKVLMTGFTLTADGASDPSTAIPTPSPVLDRARQAAAFVENLSEADKGVLLERLKDPSELVRMNAAATLGRLKVAEAVLPLVDLCRSATPAIADLAAQALAYQNTDAAWGALLQLSVNGPFDHNRQFAARELAAKAEPLSAGSISSMMTCRSPQAREQAARSIGAIKARDAGLVLMAFLMESDPNVRLAVVECSNMELELVNRRLLWSAVNDPSEAVRLAAYLRLMTSKLPEFVTEAYKGVRDESKAIRLAVLEAMAVKPAPDMRGSLRLAVTDSTPEVRAAALRAFAVLPGPIEPAEVENTFVDADPRVQWALISLAKAKGLRLPEAALAQLRGSISEDVARAAKELGS